MKGQHIQIFMKSNTSPSIGAEPVTILVQLPPKIDLVLPKTKLSQKPLVYEQFYFNPFNLASVPLDTKHLAQPVLASIPALILS